MNYKHSNSSKPIPGIFNKIENLFCCNQLLQFENRNLKHLQIVIET
jgi:hypothetical protein